MTVTSLSEAPQAPPLNIFTAELPMGPLGRTRGYANEKGKIVFGSSALLEPRSPPKYP